MEPRRLDYEPPVKRHTGAGIASMCMALAFFAGTGALMLFAKEIRISRTQELLSIFTLCACPLVGIVFGIVGVCRKDRDTITATLGLYVNGVLLAVLMILVTAMSRS